MPLLEDHYDEVVVVDRKTAHISQVAQEGRFEYVFGDFRHNEVRKAAGLKQADFVLSSSVQTEVNEALLHEVGADTTVFVEAEQVSDARRLYAAGATYVMMNTYLSAEKFSSYLVAYFTDRPAFEASIERERRHIRDRSERSRAGGDEQPDLEVDPRTLGGDD